MVKEKVYCAYCKHYDPIYNTCKLKIEKQNKNNDCKYYEEYDKYD